MYTKILIANRCEIALRIIRACREMGIKTVAIYSETDKDALHVSLADESYCIGPVALADSYLDMDRILTVAVMSEAEAIHPGYGMLSENAEFAAKCKEAGIAFIGPDSDIIRLMGEKDKARKLAISADVPVTPGSDLLNSYEQAEQWADEVGYPVVLKASFGGGGKGIRVVRTKEDMAHAYETVREEAIRCFGDGSVFAEKYLENVKHVEVQIIADRFGHISAIGDRDCSIQRKNQKLIEECPAPTISNELRSRLYEAAVRLAGKVGYSTVGTVEYLVTDDEHFFFCEMNTRLQVEHSVTEEVCGMDIVKWQIRTSAGLELPENFKTSEKHAIECRICAEDPVSFAPSVGNIDILHIPGGYNIRFDCALYQNMRISPFYDSMLGKLITSAPTREEAVRKMRSALAELIIKGITTNVDMHLEILDDNDFLSGQYKTDYFTKRR